jgi:gliding motility-associated-like protein
MHAQLGFCTGNSGDPIFTENFGTGTDYGPPLPAGTTDYNFVGFNGPQDGQYTVGSNTFSYGWNLPSDHTVGDTNGKALIVNASFTTGEFYRRSVSDLCENTTYEFSSWLINILPSTGCGGNGIPVNVQFEIWDITDTSLLASGDTGDIFSSAAPTWLQYGLVFQTLPGQTAIILKMINNGVGGCGNDLAIDDIEFKSCGDVIAVEDSSNGNDSVVICGSQTPYSDTITAIPDFAVFQNHFYQWQVSADGLNWSDIIDETNASISLTGITESTYYRTKVAEFATNLSNSDCITFSDIYQITVNPSPLAPTSDGDVDFNCNFNEAILSVSAASGVTVNWYDAALDGNLLVTNNLSYVATTEGTYYAETVDDITGCSSNVRTAVSTSIFDPQAPISNGDVSYDCALNEAELSVSVPSGVTVNWYDLETGGILLLNNSTSYTANEQLTYYAESVDDFTGCTSITRTAVSVLGSSLSDNCIIPQGISPGVSPGLNDSFDLSNFAVTKLQIYNRYGTLVYSKNDYRDEWEGQTNDGNELPVGTYFYTMIYESGSKNRSGWVYVNR